MSFSSRLAGLDSSRAFASSSLARTCAIAVAAMLLAACAGKPLDKSSNAAQLASKAVVVVSVTVDEAARRRDNALFYVDTDAGMAAQTILQSTSGSSLGFALERSDFPDLFGKVYVLEVTPGKHSIDTWQLASQPTRIQPKVRPAPLQFEARAGEVTYLGNLHMNMRFGKSMLGLTVAGDALPEVRDRRDIDIPIAEAAHPALKGMIKAQVLPAGVWMAGDAGTSARVDAPAPVAPMPTPRITAK